MCQHRATRGWPGSQRDLHEILLFPAFHIVYMRLCKELRNICKQQQATMAFPSKSHLGIACVSHSAGPAQPQPHSRTPSQRPVQSKHSWGKVGIQLGAQRESFQDMPRIVPQWSAPIFINLQTNLPSLGLPSITNFLWPLTQSTPLSWRLSLAGLGAGGGLTNDQCAGCRFSPFWSTNGTDWYSRYFGAKTSSQTYFPWRIHVCYIW